MKRAVFLIGIIMSVSVTTFAQEEQFKPSGKIIGQVFSNFSTTFSGGGSASAFAIERAYFGYEYNFSKEFKGRVLFDVGNPGSGNLQMTAYVKNAFIQYSHEKFRANLGMISTNSFSTQEGFWDNRYVEKIFQDRNGFSSSADIGFYASYEFSRLISADFMFVNGEGYKKVQADSIFKKGIGITVLPVKGMTLRGYFDILGQTNAQTTLSGLIGYKHEGLAIAAEYVLQQNVQNAEGKDFSGASFFVNYSFAEKFKVFGRFDVLGSNTLEGASNAWNIAKDGNLFIAGFEFQPVKGIKFSPNCRVFNPAAANAENTTSLFLNCEIKF
jgi:hypothetical protein